MNDCCPLFPISWTVQMLGWFNARSRPGLASEAFERLWVVGNLIRQEFQGDETSEFDILGLVDHPHAASAQVFEDAVVRNGLADHGRKDSGNTRDGCGAKSMSRIGALRVDGSIAVPERTTLKLGTKTAHDSAWKSVSDSQHVPTCRCRSHVHEARHFASWRRSERIDDATLG